MQSVRLSGESIKPPILYDNPECIYWCLGKLSAFLDGRSILRAKGEGKYSKNIDFVNLGIL